MDITELIDLLQKQNIDKNDLIQLLSKVKSQKDGVPKITLFPSSPKRSVSPFIDSGNQYQQYKQIHPNQIDSPKAHKTAIFHNNQSTPKNRYNLDTPTKPKESVNLVAKSSQAIGEKADNKGEKSDPKSETTHKNSINNSKSTRRRSTDIKFISKARESSIKKKEALSKKAKHVVIDLHKSAQLNISTDKEHNLNKSQVALSAEIPHTALHSQQPKIEFHKRSGRSQNKIALPPRSNCSNSKGKIKPSLRASPNPTPPICKTPLPIMPKENAVGFHLEKAPNDDKNNKLDGLLKMALDRLKIINKKE